MPDYNEQVLKTIYDLSLNDDGDHSSIILPIQSICLEQQRNIDQTEIDSILRDLKYRNLISIIDSDNAGIISTRLTPEGMDYCIRIFEYKIPDFYLEKSPKSRKECKKELKQLYLLLSEYQDESKEYNLCKERIDQIKHIENNLTKKREYISYLIGIVFGLLGIYELIMKLFFPPICP